MLGCHSRGHGWRAPAEGDMGSQVDMKGVPDGDWARDKPRRAWGDIEAGIGLPRGGGAPF